MGCSKPHISSVLFRADRTLSHSSFIIPLPSLFFNPYQSKKQRSHRLADRLIFGQEIKVSRFKARRSKEAGGWRLFCPRHKKTSEQSGLCSDVELVVGIEPTACSLRVILTIFLICLPVFAIRCDATDYTFQCFAHLFHQMLVFTEINPK